MARGVADTEMIRRQNRALVLSVLRREGALSRTAIASLTGLSNASLTAIAADLVNHGVLVELEDNDHTGKGRGRPAILIAHNRQAASVILIELDVTRCRLSLLDYGAVLQDRFENSITPEVFANTAPATFLAERIAHMCERNPGSIDRLRNISISVQGILDPDADGMRWSPIPHLAHNDIVTPLEARFDTQVSLYKRGRLMAEGVRWLRPATERAAIATIFIGSTIGMGLSFSTSTGVQDDIGTEFGHMHHIVNGALCRCGARGCIEAYASDYGILRTAYSVPDHHPPASAVPPADFQQIVSRAHGGDRNAIHAFFRAGNAIGHGIARLMSIVNLDQVVLLGPAAMAYDLIKPGLADGAAATLMGRINGLPPIDVIHDAGEPIFKGLTMKALTEIDRNDFALQPKTLTGMTQPAKDALASHSRR